MNLTGKDPLLNDKKTCKKKEEKMVSGKKKTIVIQRARRLVLFLFMKTLGVEHRVRVSVCPARLAVPSDY